MSPPDRSSRPSYLLLLPPTPSSITSTTDPDSTTSTYTSISAVYTAPLTATLKALHLERRRESIGSVLEIALPCPVLPRRPTRTRAQLYPHVQKLLASVYKLICVVAAREGVNVEDVRGVDIRVLLVGYPPAKSAKSEAQGGAAEHEASNGKGQMGEEGGETGQQRDQRQDGTWGDPVSSIICLETLARCGRPWTSVIAVEREEGEALLKAFCLAQDGRVKIRRVPAGMVEAPKASQSDDGQDDLEEGGEKQADHLSVAVGGTFDHIHVGHKLLLTMFAFMLSEPQTGDVVRSLTIGITGDELLKNKKYAELLESWDERQKVVLDFMRSVLDFRPQSDAEMKSETKNEKGPNGHAINSWLGEQTVVKCVELSDPFGPTITDEQITALVISAETRSGGKAINDKRREKGWAELKVFEVDVLDTEEDIKDEGEQQSFEAKLSSTTIRKKIHEREGETKAKPP